MTDVPEARTPWRRLSAKTIGAAASLALLAAACGSTSPDTVSASPSPEPTEAAPAEASSEAEASPEAENAPEGPVDLSNYPAVVVKDIATGGDLELATVLADGQTPTLLWFWAPH